MIIETTEININQEIERIVSLNKDGYMQAILSFCEEKNIDPIYVAKHLSTPIKERLHAEGVALNLLPRSARLPI